MKPVACIRNVEGETFGLVGEVLREQGLPIVEVDAWHDSFPELDEVSAYAVFGGDQYDIVNSLTGNAYIGHDQGLGIQVTVHGVGEEFAERGGLDVGRCQCEFVGIGSVAREIMVIGGDAREVGNGEDLLLLVWTGTNPVRRP